MIDIIGAGLAGSEAAWQVAKRGVHVRLIEMKPSRRTAAHTSDHFAELVCSNSLRSDSLLNAAGLLKAEMELLDSLIMRCARETAVEAGGALAVDRNRFAALVTRTLREHPLITIEEREVHDLSAWKSGRPLIIAAGPLCTDSLAKGIAELTGSDFLSFYDAVAPIVTSESVDMSKAFWGGRYGRGSDYVNCPMNRSQYESFWKALTDAEKAPVHGFDAACVFEGCMPIEEIASRGIETMRFGPLKPKGLTDPATDREPYAVVQLRKEDADGRLLNLVGFQTRLKFREQERVFRMIPALENAEIQRWGVMHRNTFIHSPKVLDTQFRLKDRPWIRFAGQITGVEGYIESAASGLLAGMGAALEALGRELPSFGPRTALGALCAHVSNQYTDNFQPSNITFGLMEPLGIKVRKREERNRQISERALDELRQVRDSQNL